MVTERLERRRAGSAALLHRIERLLHADQRITTAWLTGSYGRGDHDALSDLDIGIAFDDRYRDAIIAERHAWVAQIAPPLLIRDAPRNAPPAGSYLLVEYRGADGPHHVDWYWHPHSTALLPADARSLFARTAIPTAAPVTALTDEQRRQAAVDRITFFWSMSSIAAKKIARHQPWAALAMLSMLRSTVDQLRHHVNGTTLPQIFEDRRTSLPPQVAGEQLAALRAMAEEVEALMRAVADVDTQMSMELVVETKLFFDLAEAMIGSHPS